VEGLILAIESSGELGGAALLEKGTLVGEELVSGPRKHGAELMPCIDRLFGKNKVAREALAVIAVNAGPGSYTGLRIGLMTAAALGFALDKPVWGVGAFDCMALQLVMSRGFDTRYKGELWPVLDARRDELMTAKFMFEKGDIKRIGGDVLIAPTEFSKHAATGSIVFGTGVAPYENSRSWKSTPAP
jgi:tRNA threonylcarbamoyladenosine biosynthesis protein TsaB